MNLRGGQNDSLGLVLRNEWAEDGTTLLLESALANIRDEIAEEFAYSLVSPFREGEPIGTIQHPKEFWQMPETEAERWNRRQHELRELRAKNDRRLANG